MHDILTALRKALSSRFSALEQEDEHGELAELDASYESSRLRSRHLLESLFSLVFFEDLLPLPIATGRIRKLDVRNISLRKRPTDDSSPSHAMTII